jgi:thiopeptide-type bacteriocin biosynthesis protein
MRSHDTAADNIGASGFFVLRTPLLPFSDFLTWTEGLEARHAHVADPERLEDALVEDRARLRARLKRIVDRPEFRDAVFVASPSLDAATELWRRDPDTDRAQAAEQSLVAYLSRATARPTPFGLFAGCTTGTIGTHTRLRLESAARYQRHSRLDMEFLWRLAEAIEGDQQLRRNFVYRPNSSLYDGGDRLFYAEARQTETGRSYRLVAVDKTPYLDATLQRAGTGARLDVLAAGLVDGDVSAPEAEEYIGQLVESQILCADVRPQLTGDQPTGALVRTLRRHSETAPLGCRIDAASDRLAAMDAAGPGAAPDEYRRVASELEGLPASPTLSRLVQVDLTKPANELSLGARVVSEILGGVRALHALTRPRPPDALARFREDFARRYESREVPLVEALDEENGIGFQRSGAASADAAPLLEGLPLQRVEEQPGRWTRRDALLLRKLMRAMESSSREIEIGASDLAARNGDALPLPDAFEVVASIEAASHEAVDRGEFRVHVHTASGPPGARLVGRFCHVDEALHRHVREHLGAEESNHPDRLFAEIVHQPEGRVGNILTRPVLRDYEIPYLGESGAPDDRQLPISDLLVSVRGDRIVLRSRRLGREVVPRLTTAHNHAWRSLPVYRFLCELQHQGVASGLTWDWGPLESAPVLPRVVTGRAVLSRARWNLDHDDLGAFRHPPGRTQFSAVQELRATRALPRWIALADGDNELVTDLDNVLSIESLARQLRKRPSAPLVEVLPAPDQLCAAGPEGAFAHQIVVPFVRSSPTTPSAAPTPTVEASTRRRLAPGSEWLYVKLYTGTTTADRLLDAATGVIKASLSSGAGDRWFFIRYGDPDWHLRIRIHGDPERLLHETLPRLNALTDPMLDGGRLWRVQIDTYEREVERYGGDRGVDLAERIFHADSDAVVAILGGLHGDSGAELRWRAALAGIDLLLDDLGLTLEHKAAIARRACDGYGHEFGAGPAFRRELSRRYREHRLGLERMLDPQAEPPAALAPSLAALWQRSASIRPVAAELRRLEESGRLLTTVPDFAMSCAHMHVNRLLRSGQRAQELVLYEMLDRVYSSQAARKAR